ncbi:MAG: NFACT RNA binding domain-containing protein [Gemmatimonadota bacterium]|nr:NFACT RNA binding domain-containing protein [Gemmatimonadota bacterium]
MGSPTGTLRPDRGYQCGMSIRWDALLTRHMAEELQELLVGTHLRAFRLDGTERDLVLLFRERTVIWRLHPSRGQILLRRPVDPGPSDLRYPARVREVSVPPDERWIRIELLAKRGHPPYDLTVELLGNQWNAVIAEAPSGITRHVLWSRDTGRGHRVGERYHPPDPRPRAGVPGEGAEVLDVERWREILAPLAPEHRRAALVRGVAWASPLNASYLLAEDVEGSDEERLSVGYQRWCTLADGAPGRGPVVLEWSGGPQPYPLALPSVPYERVSTLFEAFEVAGRDDGSGNEPDRVTLLDPELLRRLTDTAERARRKVEVLERELAELDDAERVRAVGDLVLARYGDIPPGEDKAVLTGFDGAEVGVELDPARAPHENADRYYREAARIERARARLPDMIERQRRAVQELDRLVERAQDGEASPEEIQAALPDRGARQAANRYDGPLKPYRTFRSTGGLEIRVGRGARHNDELTFKHSAPHDVWLHARHAAGAHVILRWQGPGNPPARDLAEAATLAALHSKARTSGSVPVDWTLRKYVRKPRKAPRGAVVPDRVSTLFVRPDPTLERALASE